MAAQATYKGRIFCTEDHEDTRDLIAHVLRLEGYEVVCTDNPAYALMLARARSFDLFIIDNWLPVMSGIHLIRKLRELNHTTPILFYTGFGLPQEEADARAAGAQGYMVKPVDNEELVSEVTRLIANAKKAASSSASALSGKLNDDPLHSAPASPLGDAGNVG